MMQDEREDLVRLKGKVTLTFTDVVTGAQEVETIDNLVMLVARTTLLKALLGITSTGEIGKTPLAEMDKVFIKGISVGTGTTTVVESNTKLEAEVAVLGGGRQTLTSASVRENVAIFRAFFSSTEANVTITELGLWGGAFSKTVSDSGTLFSRVGSVSKTKTNDKSLSVEWSITLEG